MTWERGFVRRIGQTTEGRMVSELKGTAGKRQSRDSVSELWKVPCEVHQEVY